MQPSRGTFLITPVVKNLILINVVVFIATMFLFGDGGVRELGLYYPQSEYFRPYQIISYMFMHAGFGHIFFNMLGLFMFGSLVEMRFGPKVFLIFYFVCGLGAAALHFGIEGYRIAELQSQLAGTENPDLAETLHMKILLLKDSPLVGASGCVYGLLAAVGVLYAEQQFMLLFPPMPIKGKWMAIGYGALEFFYGTAGSSDDIAHFAHIGGMITGLLLILYWKWTKRVY